MKVTVGTFNLNNLFSRFNFSGAIEEIQTGGPTGGLTIRYEFTDPSKINQTNEGVVLDLSITNNQF